MKFLDIIEKNKKSNLKKKNYSILILSNITLFPLKEYLEYYLKINKIFTTVNFGDYNSFINNSEYLNKFDCIIFFWDFINILEQKIQINERINKIDSELFYNKVKKEINLSLRNIKDDKLIIFNKFTDVPFKSYYKIDKKYKSEFVFKINKFLETKKIFNLFLINIENIIKSNIEENFSYQQFNLNKSFYSLKFYEKYVKYIKEIIVAKNLKPKKNIILDCDNTLWNGIIGEPEKKNKTLNAQYYNKVTKILKDYQKNGILLSLCSKNNFNDVRNYFKAKNIKYLNFEDFVNKKINWKPKHQNILDISKELNLALDSFIFIDDSEYEINLVKKYLPEVTTIKVPEKKIEYPELIKNLKKYFTSNITSEDINKTKMYFDENLRQKSKKNFDDIVPYLRSLKLQMSFFVNKVDHIERISQMSLKTNQFNLTTKRYKTKEIKNMFNSKNYLIFTIYLKDNFGDYGVTGLSIVKINKDIADIDTFLLSCRVLGRDIHEAFFIEIHNFLKNQGVKQILGSYKYSSKNSQVENFYENLKFILLKKNKKSKNYYKNISRAYMKKISYIGIKYE